MIKKTICIFLFLVFFISSCSTKINGLYKAHDISYKYKIKHKNTRTLIISILKENNGIDTIITYASGKQNVYRVNSANSFGHDSILDHELHVSYVNDTFHSDINVYKHYYKVLFPGEKIKIKYVIKDIDLMDYKYLYDRSIIVNNLEYYYIGGKRIYKLKRISQEKKHLLKIKLE